MVTVRVCKEKWDPAASSRHSPKGKEVRWVEKTKIFHEARTLTSETSHEEAKDTFKQWLNNLRRSGVIMEAKETQKDELKRKEQDLEMFHFSLSHTGDEPHKLLLSYAVETAKAWSSSKNETPCRISGPCAGQRSTGRGRPSPTGAWFQSV